MNNNYILKKQCCIILIILAFCSEVFSNIEFDPKVISTTISLVNQDYRKAEKTLKAIIAGDPDNIDAIYVLSTVYQTELLDYESYTFRGDKFLTYLDSVLEIMNKRLELLSGKDSVKCLFYIGNIYGGKSVILAKQGHWVLAIKKAFESVAILKKVKTLDPSMLEADLGIGVFDYYLSQRLKWIPFFNSKKEKGLEKIIKSTNSVFPFNFAAKNTLCWILIENGKLEKADSIAKEVIRELPDNTIFLRIRARIALMKKNYVLSEKLADKLTKISLYRSPVNWSDLFSGYQILIQSYENTGSFKALLKTTGEALSHNMPEYTALIPYVNDHLEYIRQKAKEYKTAENN